MPLFFQAADLLRHPHLQSHILKINLKVNNPRRNTFPMQWSDSDYVKKARFVEPEAVTVLTDTEKRSSYNNDRALNPSISGTELDSPCSSQRARHFPAFLNKKFSEFSVGSINEDGDGDKSTATKLPSAAKTPRLTPAKTSSTPRRLSVPSKYRDLVSLYSIEELYTEIELSFSWHLTYNNRYICCLCSFLNRVLQQSNRCNTRVEYLFHCQLYLTSPMSVC